METAYRMQFEALDVFDVREEPEKIREEYGCTPFANGCLLARRLVEKGVRYVHVYYGPGQPWDDHKEINKNLRERCPDMDQAAAALIRDLKTARTVGGNPRRLGRGVRPHTGFRIRRRTRPQPVRLHDVDGGRRRSRRRQLRHHR